MKQKNHRKPFSERSRQQEAKAIRNAIWLGCFVMVTAVLIALAYPAELNFKDCEAEAPADCGCPTNLADSRITKNVVFIDATDPLPPSKTRDTIELLRAFTLESDLFSSLVGAHQRTSVFVFSNQKPDQLKPVASFCKLPNSFVMSLRYSQSAIDSFSGSITKVVNAAAANSQLQQHGSNSTLVQAIAVTTGSGAYWNSKGRYVFVSDLIERSSECGLFDKTEPTFANNSRSCTQYVTRAKEMMAGSKAYVCLIPRSSQPLLAGVTPWWQEYFQTITGAPATLTCDPALVVKNL
jgi:hypothetical protein